MKYILYITIIIGAIACSNKLNTAKNAHIIESKKKDSLENQRYMYLKGFATCKCVYGVPENSQGKASDISPSIFADIVNFWGIDTLSFLANKEAQKIKLSKYKDYQTQKPTFIHCYEWANSPYIDTLVRKYAKSSAEEWIEKERIK